MKGEANQPSPSVSGEWTWDFSNTLGRNKEPSDMIARLWWKEARQVGPIWVFLAGLGLFWMAVIQWYFTTGSSPRATLSGPALFITFIYMFLIGAAAFAGERENRTLALLDALPVERWRAWVAKASFGAASTLALGVLLFLFAIALEGFPPENGRAMIGYLLACGFGWSLFWSALSGNALLAAALAIVSLGLSFAQLNMGESLMVRGINSDALTAWHWLFAVALVAASALILHLGGPPRASWVGTRRRPRRAPVQTREMSNRLQPLVTVRTGLASRLVWQALREVWPVWWPLALIGVGLPLVWAVTNSSNDPALWLLGSLAVSLVAGANVFNAENRRGTQRFLAHHGARPGVIWLAKLAVGLATVAPIWLFSVWLTPTLWVVRGNGLAPAPWAVGGFVGFLFAAVLIGGFLTGAFASGAWCGMVFRRGITAGLVSLILWLVVCLPPLLLVPIGLVWPMHLPWIPIAILAVTWAWSGDWLLDRPGFGRWARLGTYSASALAILFSAYVAERAWNVPTIPAAERERIFQFDRIGQLPYLPEDNAADVYRALAPRIRYIDENQDENDPMALHWLNQNKPILEELRKAAAMPVCRFHDLRKQTVFPRSQLDPNPYWLSRPLDLSSRVRLDQGDLKGAWDDIDSLFRISRQFGGLNPGQGWWTGRVENSALFLAMRWAADPRQTAETLEAARDAYRALPPFPSRADQLRANALIVNNTLDMPREDLVREAMAREGERKNVSPLVKLAIDAMTTPWELARVRRVHNLLAAARIQLVEADPTRTDFGPRFEELSSPLVIGRGPNAAIVSAMELQRLVMTTPQVGFVGSGYVESVVPPMDENNAAPRRAFDVILALRLWQVRHDGRLPRSLDELETANPEIGESLIDPYSNPPARFGYVASGGQSLLPLGSFNPIPDVPSARTDLLKPTQGFMLLYSVGPDKTDDRASFNLDVRNKGDIVFPLKDEVPPPK